MVTIDNIQIFIMTHNRAALLGESIESILNQTAGVKELTVLDNESTDGTEEVALSFLDKGVKYQKTCGFLGNFYKAKEIVNKEYVMLFHDDDILHPEYLEKAIAVLNKEKNLAAVYSRYTEFQGGNSPKTFENLKTCIRTGRGMYKDDVYEGGGYYVFENQKAFAFYMFFCERIAYCSAVYRSDLFKKIDLEYEKFSKFNDWPFMAKFGKFGKIAVLCDRNALYIRRHDLQDTWTYANTPSFEQILNWDKFFIDIIFKRDDTFLRKLYSRRATHFYVGKYQGFVSPAKKEKFSEDDLRKLAKQEGIPERDDNLISQQTYDAYLRFFSEKRLRPLSGASLSFIHIIKRCLKVIYCYLKFDMRNCNVKR